MDDDREHATGFLPQAGPTLKAFRTLLQDGMTDHRQVDEALRLLAGFEQAADQWGAQSCCQISEQSKKLLARHRAAEQLPGPLETEVLELAADWLEQLVALFSESLPEPRTLVAELLDAFALVDRYRGAELTLAEVYAEHGATSRVGRNDPFANDPEFAVEQPEGAAGHPDPFGEDPGFSLEFDLLQRTLRRVPQMPADDADPFSRDPFPQHADNGDEILPPDRKEHPAPFDPFAGDPPAEGPSEDA